MKQLNTMNHSCTGARGFTLIEILIAITLFAVGILAVASLQLNAIKGNSRANIITLAGAVASDRSEQIRSMAFDHDDLSDGVHPAVAHDRLWTGWTVKTNVPLRAMTEDTDGKALEDGEYPLCKTIEIIVFSNSSGFDDRSADNRLLTCSIVKTRHL